MSENSTSNKNNRGLGAGQWDRESDNAIDTSDIPEVIDWSNAERGRFYRPNTVHQIPVYLDSSVREALYLIARVRPGDK